MGAHESRDRETQGKSSSTDGCSHGNSGWLISGHEKFRFEYGNLANMRLGNLENLKFWKVVRMRHAIVENDGMPRGILLQRSLFPNMPYRAKNRKFRKLPKIKKNQKNCPGAPSSYQPTWAGSMVCSPSAQAHDGWGPGKFPKLFRRRRRRPPQASDYFSSLRS